MVRIKGLVRSKRSLRRNSDCYRRAVNRVHISVSEKRTESGGGKNSKKRHNPFGLRLFLCVIDRTLLSGADKGTCSASLKTQNCVFAKILFLHTLADIRSLSRRGCKRWVSTFCRRPLQISILFSVADSNPFKSLNILHDNKRSSARTKKGSGGTTLCQSVKMCFFGICLGNKVARVFTLNFPRFFVLILQNLLRQNNFYKNLKCFVYDLIFF